MERWDQNLVSRHGSTPGLERPSASLSSSCWTEKAALGTVWVMLLNCWQRPSLLGLAPSGLGSGGCSYGLVSHPGACCPEDWSGTGWGSSPKKDRWLLNWLLNSLQLGEVWYINNNAFSIWIVFSFYFITAPCWFVVVIWQLLLLSLERWLCAHCCPWCFSTTEVVLLPFYSCGGSERPTLLP